jgi:MYXO-CTERM domain-containing protein
VIRALLGLLVALCIALPSLAHAQAKIVIDPGHGGTDPGGVGTGMQEKNIVLDVSKRFKQLLDADTADTGGGGKWTSLMTRSTDVFVSLAGRSQYSNNQGADRFMSIHSNAFSDPGANGTETFSYTTAGNGAALRNLVQDEMIKAWGLTNRGNKTANFAVLRDTAAPAELHELAFITNATDAAKLGSATERQKAAEAHLKAIQRHYGFAPYVPGGTPPPPQDTDGEIAGHVSDDAGPVAGVTIKLDGGASVLTDAEGAFVFTKAAAGDHVISASAEGYSAAMVDVTVAAGVRAEVDILLERDGTGEPGEEPPPGESAGCRTGSTPGPLLLLALAALLSFRRRRA